MQQLKYKPYTRLFPMSSIDVHGPSLLRSSQAQIMAPTTPRSAQRKVRKIHSRPRIGKHRIHKRSSPKSPRAFLPQKHTHLSTKVANVNAKAGSSQGDLVVAHHKHKHVKSKRSPRILKYKIATQWPSSEPFEKNCLQREPLPDGYVFVPRGDVYITRNCRSKTKESHRLVYKVYDNTGKKAVGIRIPSDVYTAVLQSAEDTAESRANAVKVRDEKDLTRARQLLRKQFPLMPAESLDIILQHAFLKGSGRVGRASTTTDERKAILAVEAHIRHTHTPYETLLRGGEKRDDARKEVWGTVQAIRRAWEGHGTQPTLLTLRNRE